MGRADWSSDLAFKTVNGSIRVTLPASASTTVDAETVNGSIVSDFAVSDGNRPAPAPDRHHRRRRPGDVARDRERQHPHRPGRPAGVGVSFALRVFRPVPRAHASPDVVGINDFRAWARGSVARGTHGGVAGTPLREESG